MKIGGQTIGAGHGVFVIAEIGVNHDGSVERACELVRHAKAAGADAVKLQVFRADTLVHASAEFAGYQKDKTEAASPAAKLRQYELDDSALRQIADAARDAGLSLLATPFSPDDVPRVAAIADAVKIASPDLVNYVLLSRVVATGLPIIVSTGASTADEIDASVRWLKQRDADFALLHCVSNYPVSEADAQLCWIGELADFGVPVGYSDHVEDPAAGALAVVCGACVIEKHLTYDTAAAGPDHAASLDPAGFADYVRRVRQAERMLGTRGRHVLPCEADVRRVSRQSLVLRRDVPAGRPLVADDFTTQRPGTGVPAAELEQIIGQAAAVALPAGRMLTREDVRHRA